MITTASISPSENPDGLHCPALSVVVTFHDDIIGWLYFSRFRVHKVHDLVGAHLLQLLGSTVRSAPVCSDRLLLQFVLLHLELHRQFLDRFDLLRLLFRRRTRLGLDEHVQVVAGGTCPRRSSTRPFSTHLREGVRIHFGVRGRFLVGLDDLFHLELLQILLTDKLSGLLIGQLR